MAGMESNPYDAPTETSGKGRWPIVRIVLVILVGLIALIVARCAFPNPARFGVRAQWFFKTAFGIDIGEW